MGTLQRIKCLQIKIYMLYCTHRIELIITRNVFVQIVLRYNMSKIYYSGSFSQYLKDTDYFVVLN